MYLRGPQGKEGPPANLTLNNVPLPYTEEVTYLGMKLNNRLDWKPHIDAKINAAKAQIMLINTATGKYWGPKPSLMLWAYKQVILPALCYGCVVFAHTLDEKRLAKLRRLNRLALQIIAPIARSAPTGGLEVITDTPPIHLEMQRRSMTTVLRIERPKPIWDGIMSNGSLGFYQHWRARIPNTLSGAPPNRCRTLFNWVPGRSATLRPPLPRMSADNTSPAPPRAVKHWRLIIATKDWESEIAFLL